MASQIAAQLELIAADSILQKDLEILPRNYTFEIPKTIWKIRTTDAKFVALQFPEGLTMYACLISDILEKHTGCRTIIMGDVTYGACCVDDYTAKMLGCDLLVHYGHSCLVPIQNTEGIHMLYIFVNIDINLSHLLSCLIENFEKGKKIALISTIQFIPSLHTIKKNLVESGFDILLPQAKPLSPGEVLGCTSPRLPSDVQALIYVGDGRFHLESAMIHNPSISAFQYDPYARKLTREEYDFPKMRSIRSDAIKTAQKANFFGLIQGTLGRQGNIKIAEELEAKLVSKGKKFVRVLLSEIFPDKLALFKEIDCWVQVACPRLSIDWGAQFGKPLLSPYELAVALEEVVVPTDYYPMDYYSNESTGPWTNNHVKHRPVREKKRPRVVVAQEMKD